MNNNQHQKNSFEASKKRIEQVGKNQELVVPELFESEFTIEEDLGADYYRKLTNGLKDFCSCFQLPFNGFTLVEEDPIGGNYLRQSTSDESIIVFKLTNLFSPVSEQKSAQLDVVVSQSCNLKLPSKFNLRFTNDKEENNFAINNCKVIVLEEKKLEYVEQQSKFWITMVNL